MAVRLGAPAVAHSWPRDANDADPDDGIASRWRGTRIGSMAVSLLLAEAITKARGAGIEETEISWILETNRAMLNLARRLPLIIPVHSAFTSANSNLGY